MSERIMPTRWFYGALGNSTIDGIVNDRSASRRALAPAKRTLGRFIVPPFQRDLVWSEEQKARLIESIYIGMPIGALVWNQTVDANPCDNWLLDGQQRTGAICGYLAGEFAVQGWLYPELPEIEKRHFQRMYIPVVETSITDPDICREVYDRLAYGGTVHAPDMDETIQNTAVKR